VAAIAAVSQAGFYDWPPFAEVSVLVGRVLHCMRSLQDYSRVENAWGRLAMRARCMSRGRVHKWRNDVESLLIDIVTGNLSSGALDTSIGYASTRMRRPLGKCSDARASDRADLKIPNNGKTRDRGDALYSVHVNIF
jgi:hypothetical protein